MAELEQVPKAFRAAGNQRRAAAKERIKDDAIGHGRVSDRILAEIEDNHMRERDTKSDQLNKGGGFSGDSVPNFTTQKQTKKSTLRGKLSKCSFRKQSAN